MKILNKVDISNWKFFHTCVICETEMEADQSDLKYQPINGAPWESDYDEFYFYCPTCNEKIRVPSKEMPKLLQLEVKKAQNKSEVAGPWR